MPLLGDTICNELLWARQGRVPRAKMIDMTLLVIGILLKVITPQVSTPIAELSVNLVGDTRRSVM